MCVSFLADSPTQHDLGYEHLLSGTVTLTKIPGHIINKSHPHIYRITS